MKSSNLLLLFCFLGFFTQYNCQEPNIISHTNGTSTLAQKATNESVDSKVKETVTTIKPLAPNSEITNDKGTPLTEATSNQAQPDSTAPKIETTNPKIETTTPKIETTTPKIDTTTDKDNTSTTSTTTTSTTTTTTTTTTPKTTTTSVAPDTSTSTSTQTPNITTTVPPTTTTAPPTPTPKPPPCNRFDGSSFVGGIVLTLGLLAIGLVAYKFYKARNERNYHTL